tara:strand:+ start:3405 stop:6056 length:2652 start_codon:yes stop_codon:yes gene_type:complete
MSQNIIQKQFDLIDILKELNYSDTFPDQLYPAILFRTLFLIDSLHDFSDYTRVANKIYTKQEAINLCNHIINMFKIDCYYIIHNHSKNKLDQYKLDQYNLLKNIFHGDNLNFFFVFPQLYSSTFFTNAKTADNTKKYKHMDLNNELFKKKFKEKKNKAFITKFDGDTNISIMMYTGYIYSKEQDVDKPPEKHVQNLLLINYTGDKTDAPGKTISDKYRNALKQHCIVKSFDANSNVTDSLHYILSIADILDSCVSYINNCSSTYIISADNLKRYKTTILNFFNVIPDIKTPINVPQDSNNGIITSWGFVHGLLNIKKNKCKKDIKPTKKLVFTIDAEGNTGKDYLYMFNRFNFINNDEAYSKLDCISTLGTQFDSANISSFSKLSNNMKEITDLNLNQNINRINHKYSKYNYDIKLTCGEIVCIHIKYSLLPETNNVKAQIMNWFDNDFSTIDFCRNNSYSLKTSAIEYVNATNKTDLNIKYGHYFKTVSDVGQLLCFMALINNRDTDFNDALHIFHTNDSFCFSIASLLHYGVVYEDSTQLETDAKTSAQLLENISKTNNKIMISKKCISSKGGFEEYNIEWHKMFKNPISQEKSNELIKEAIDNAKKEQTEFLENIYLEQLNDYKFKNLTLEVQNDIIKAQKNVIDVKKQLISQIRNLKYKVNLDNEKIKGLRKTRKLYKEKSKNAKTTAKKNDYIERRNNDLKKIQKTQEEVLSKLEEISKLEELLKQKDTNDEYHVNDELSPVLSNNSQISNSSSSSSSSSRSPEQYEEVKIVSAKPVQSVSINDKTSRDERQPTIARVVKQKPRSPPKSNSKSAKKRVRKNSSSSSSSEPQAKILKATKKRKRKRKSSSSSSSSSERTLKRRRKYSPIASGKKTRRKN